MQHHKIEVDSYPLKKGESWWVVHPNRSGCEFRVPIGAVTVCTETFMPFLKDYIAAVISVDYHNGWITLKHSNGDYYDLPFYLFARFFDAEAFVIGSAHPADLEDAKPFNYEPTLPVRFADGSEPE